MPCVIYLHGNSGCRLDAFGFAEILIRENITLFCFDFTGSGISGGEYTSLGHYEKEDLECVVEYLRSLKFVSKIALWGRSMGAATSIYYTEKD